MSLLDMFGGQRSQGGSMSPLTMAMLGLLAYRTLRGQGTPNAPVAAAGADTVGQSTPVMLGGLGSLLSGTAGGSGILSTGLQDLLDRFRQSGHGDKAESWISTGPNKPIEPQQIGEAIGEDRIQWLIQQTGMPRDQLLAGLSANLPEIVNKLTPNGRIPPMPEVSQLIH